MYNDKILSMKNLEKFNYGETKRNVDNYFKNWERLEWELKKLNGQKGLTANYDFSVEYTKQPYTPIGKDTFNLSAKDDKEEEIKKCISSCYWAKNVLSEREQLYIEEYYINGKLEDEFINSLGYIESDDYDFKKLKKSAIYKFADFLNLIVEKC